MLCDGAPEKLIQLIKSYYTSTRAQVRAYGEESLEFDLYSGVLQGCPLSPILFNYVIDWIMIKATAEYRCVQLPSDTWIPDIEYVDDVVILAENFENLNFILEHVSYFSNHIGLEVNLSKTKALSTCSSVGLAPAISGSIL